MRHPSIARWLFALVATLSAFPADLLFAADGQKQVLVLFSTRRDSLLSSAGERELSRRLDAGLSGSLDYYSEYIDASRFPDPLYQAAFQDFLRLKYEGQRFDVVIAIEDTALEFIGKRRDELFPGTPVVFLALSRGARRLANSTGVFADLHFERSLALATRLQPDLASVFVVSGASSRDKFYEGLVRESLQSFESRLELTYLSGLTTTDLEKRVAALPQQSIIFYVMVSQDGAAENFRPLEYVDRLTAAANRPMYAWIDAAMNHSIVGGSLMRPEILLGVVADQALRVLQGGRADDIPTTTAGQTFDRVDWRQLRRWGINEARVPAEALVMFREFSVWDRYKVYIVSALALLIAQTALIAGLLVQGSRRRKAEAQVQSSQAALRESYDRIRDLGGRLLSAQDAERSRIARELHDDVSQQAALLAMDLELLKGSAPEADADSAQLAHEALDRAHAIARSIHALSHRLHPAKLRLIGLVAAISGLQREMSRSDVAFTFMHDDVPATLPQDLTLCMFRVVQEAVQNAMKHSAAGEIAVNLSGASQTLTLTVADDGVGFDVDAVMWRGLGLLSMMERVESLGGALTIRSTPRAGTRLEAVIPLRAESASVAG